VKIHLGGHLNFYDAQKRAWIERRVPEPMRVSELARELGLPTGEILLVTVNGRVIPDDVIVADTDRVEFYSPIGGG
jgi:sulfur carrier protein ThiS